ncbi:DUF4007 family protein [Sediminibacterium goheungense]|uniref:Uncharacterized protein DUF4007 n=1 Tax=Sediminibacterium goheungense TaxID=1086393 RepID=A0A4R6J371_9BACT|nr:DUF4007 family protein [Sediminibacterium goheungense]TDO29231.1 uncharacterized protein DUF4007 [Sediminibacterium goheungense]
MIQQRIYFSGHESFICKQFWLKKTFDFSRVGKSFNEDTAVVDLGVGKNMVASLRYWGKAFGILNENDTPTILANYLFESDTGRDLYLEDFATIWLLHYFLLKTNRFSIASLFFNELRKERIEFTKDQSVNFLLRKTQEYETNTDNANTLERDISVFLRMYSKPQKGDSIDIEDDFNGVLVDLDLMKRFKQRDLDHNLVDWYKIDSEERIDLPCEIVLFNILDNYEGQQTLTFRELLTGWNAPGVVFALNPDGLYNKLQEISERYNRHVVYTETAGNEVLQIKSQINKYDILDGYYNR